MSASTPAFCGLLPHPPIVVPAVGGARVEGCRATLEACRELARRLVASRPDRVVLPSPHSPRRAGAFGLWDGRVRGDLARFGAPGAGIDLPGESAMRDALETRAEAHGVATWRIQPIREPLDHGAVVPLWFLAEAGWDGPTTVLSIPWPESPVAPPAPFVSFGRALAEAAVSLPGRTALVASGDMSHRCTPNAPAGHHPRAVDFDHQLTEHVRRGELDRLAAIDPELRELAAEDAADTSILVSAAIDFTPREPEVLSYEHPFGVGYLVAAFHQAPGHDRANFTGEVEKPVEKRRKTP